MWGMERIRRTILLLALVSFGVGILTVGGGMDKAMIFFIISAVLGIVFVVLYLATEGINTGPSEPMLRW